MKVQAVGALADDNAFLGQRDLRVRRIRDVGHEDALPHRGPLGALYVLHVENVLGESFIEHTRLDFKRNLRSLEAIFQMAECGLRTRRYVESIQQRKPPTSGDKKR